jgi:hypothetical protein
VRNHASRSGGRLRTRAGQAAPGRPRRAGRAGEADPRGCGRRPGPGCGRGIALREPQPVLLGLHRRGGVAPRRRHRLRLPGRSEPQGANHQDHCHPRPPGVDCPRRRRAAPSARIRRARPAPHRRGTRRRGYGLRHGSHRAALPLGRDGPSRIRLLQAGHAGLGGGDRRQPAPGGNRPVHLRDQGEHGRPDRRGARLLGQQPARPDHHRARGHVHRRRPYGQRPLHRRRNPHRLDRWHRLRGARDPSPHTGLSSRPEEPEEEYAGARRQTEGNAAAITRWTAARAKWGRRVLLHARRAR